MVEHHLEVRTFQSQSCEYHPPRKRRRISIRRTLVPWKLSVHFSLSREVLISCALLLALLFACHYHLYVKVVHMQGSVYSANTKPGRRRAAASLRGGSWLTIDWKQQFSVQRTKIIWEPLKAESTILIFHKIWLNPQFWKPSNSYF